MQYLTIHTLPNSPRQVLLWGDSTLWFAFSEPLRRDRTEESSSYCSNRVETKVIEDLGPFHFSMQPPSSIVRCCYTGRTLFAVVSVARYWDFAAAFGHEPEASTNLLHCLDAKLQLVNVQAGAP